MLRNILEVLMESTPREIDATRLEKGLCEMEGVVAIHELHIWAITVGKVLLACHVTITPEADADLVLDKVKLKKRGSDTKYLATVTECDIALLTVSDEFWEGVSPIEFGSLPALQDAVTVAGYPIGGDTISVTSGVVSCMEILSYVHGSTELLGLQIDAPAFNDKGKCVGIAFQSLKHEDVDPCF
ncbi:uncharacterized protein A4U43_C02F2750 [Asparagus officinalis]|uniref:Cation efflux protein cytoplasmic domain-containing protein n=1 Tax=Asparagus officinalis TaxID=4686 RepID=A0A5P1FFB4_ASPOF|nr:uncharacterized protein A4U43_C02F2750 [Asparagus officinalis]